MLFEMSVNEESAALREFEAHPPFRGYKLASKTTPMYQNNPGQVLRRHSEKEELLRSASQPRLAIDVAADAMRVIDLHSNALIASAQLEQVTASREKLPARHIRAGRTGSRSAATDHRMPRLHRRIATPVFLARRCPCGE